MDPNFLEYLKAERLLVDYAYFVAFAVLIYDYFLTMSLEISLIWNSSWNYTKVLYLTMRYLPAVDLVFLAHNQLAIAPSVKTCRWTYPTCLWILVISMNLAEVVLAIRTYAIWRRNLFVGVFLALLMTASFTSQCVITSKFLGSLEFESPPIGFRGCFVTKSKAIIVWSYIVTLIVEVCVFTLVAASALQSYIKGDRGKLSNVVHRDGILFYAVLLFLSTLNVVVITHMEAYYWPMLTPLEDTLYSGLTARIVLNIRSVGTRPEQTHLHTEYTETLTHDLALTADSVIIEDLWAHHRNRRVQEDIELDAV